MNTIITKSAKETQKVARQFAGAIVGELVPTKKALVITLDGELGAGKTTFTQGFAEGLKIKERIKSPTFVLLRKYNLRKHSLKVNPPAGGQKSKVKSFHCFYHADCYRLSGEKDVVGIGLDEIMDDPLNIVLIEWAERIKKALPKKNIIKITFTHLDETTRKIGFN